MTEAGATGGNTQLIQDSSQREFGEASEGTLSPKSLQRVLRASKSRVPSRQNSIDLSHEPAFSPAQLFQRQSGQTSFWPPVQDLSGCPVRLCIVGGGVLRQWAEKMIRLSTTPPGTATSPPSRISLPKVLGVAPHLGELAAFREMVNFANYTIGISPQYL